MESLALHRGASLKLAITALEVLKEKGYQNPRDHILISSGEVPYFEGFFLKKSPWTKEEVEKVKNYLAIDNRNFFEGQMFLWNPIDKDGFPVYKEIINQPVSELPKYYSSLGANLKPSTDDKPFIEHFVQIGSKPISEKLPEEFHYRNSQKWRGIIPRGDFPYWAILAESALLAFLFVALPLVFFTRSKIKHPKFKNFLVYFSSLGFAFIVIEICLMKRYVLFLGNPAYSIPDYTYCTIMFCRHW